MFIECLNDTWKNLTSDQYFVDKLKREHPCYFRQDDVLNEDMLKQEILQAHKIKFESAKKRKRASDKLVNNNSSESSGSKDVADDQEKQIRRRKDRKIKVRVQIIITFDCGQI